MPKPLLVDWPLIQALFTQGLPPKRIVDRLSIPGLSANTITQRAKRGKWSVLRYQVRDNAVMATAQVLKSERSRLQEESAQARNALSSEVLGQLTDLGDIKRSTSLESAATRSQVARTLAETAKTVYGWDADSARRTIINVALMESVDEPACIDVDVAPSVAPTPDPATPG